MRPQQFNRRANLTTINQVKELANTAKQIEKSMLEQLGKANPEYKKMAVILDKLETLTQLM